MKLEWIIALLGVLMLIAAPAAGQPTPFLVSGWVNDSSGGAVLDPDVVITNLNTGKIFTAGTAADSNYYQVMTCSYNMSAGDVLNFSSGIDHTVTPAELDAGGFKQNLTVEQQLGLCGDVDCKDGVTIGDGIQIAMSIVYGTDDYPLADPWAADVDCKDGVTIGDGIQIAMSIVYGTDDYPLECCE